MAVFKKYNNTIGFAIDSVSFGTWNAPAKFLLLQKIDPPAYSREIIDHALTRGNPYQHVDDINEGFESSTLTLTGPVPIVGTDDAFLIILANALPKVTRTGSSVPYTHLFVPQKDEPTLGLSFSACIGGAKRYKIAGCRIKSLKLSGEVNGTMTFEASLIGGKIVEDKTMDTPSFSLISGRPKFWESPNCAVSLELPTGTALSNFVKWEFALENTVLSSPTQAGQLGNDTFVQLPFGEIKATGKITRRLDVSDGSGGTASKMFDLFKNLNDTPLRIKYTGPAFSGTNYSLQIDSRIVITERPALSDDGGIYMEEGSFQCRYDGTNPIMAVTTVSASATPAST